MNHFIDYLLKNYANIFFHYLTRKHFISKIFV